MIRKLSLLFCLFMIGNVYGQIIPGPGGSANIAAATNAVMIEVKVLIAGSTNSGMSTTTAYVAFCNIGESRTLTLSNRLDIVGTGTKLYFPDDGAIVQFMTGSNEVADTAVGYPNPTVHTTGRRSAVNIAASTGTFGRVLASNVWVTGDSTLDGNLTISNGYMWIKGYEGGVDGLYMSSNALMFYQGQFAGGYDGALMWYSTNITSTGQWYFLNPWISTIDHPGYPSNNYPANPFLFSTSLGLFMRELGAVTTRSDTVIASNMFVTGSTGTVEVADVYWASNLMATLIASSGELLASGLTGLVSSATLAASNDAAARSTAASGAVAVAAGQGSNFAVYVSEQATGMVRQGYVEIGMLAVGTNRGIAVGSNAVGYGQGVAVGESATGREGGTSIGKGSFAFSYGAAVGWGSLGYYNGAAMGYAASADTYGVGIGSGSDGRNYGAALGQAARAANTNVAVGNRAYCDPATPNKTAMGSFVTNDLVDTTRVRGALYLDGGTNIYGRGTMGTGTWIPLNIVQTNSGFACVLTNVFDSITSRYFYSSSGILTNRLSP